MNTINEVEQYASQHGIVLTQAEREEISRIQESERTRLQKVQPITKSFTDRFNSVYPKLLAFLAQAGDTIMTFSQTVIVSLGVPVVLVLLLIVEHQRVMHGIALFETDYALANFASFALVLLNLVLEFQIHYVEHHAGYIQERGTVWSIRLALKNLAYRVGIGDGWEPLPQSPAQRYKSLLKIVTFSILALALVGSMKTTMQTYTGVWYQALGDIVMQSELTEIMTWLGGLLFAFSAVLSAQGLSRYVSIRCVEILSKPVATSNDLHAQQVENVGAVTALAIVNAKIQKKQDKANKDKPTANNPFGFIPHAQDAHGYTMTITSDNGHGTTDTKNLTK